MEFGVLDQCLSVLSTGSSPVAYLIVSACSISCPISQYSVLTYYLKLLYLMLVAQLCPTLQAHGLQPTRLLCPWDFPGKVTGVGCHFFLQGIFPNQDQTQVSCTADRFFTDWATREAYKPIASLLFDKNGITDKNKSSIIECLHVLVHASCHCFPTSPGGRCC